MRKLLFLGLLLVYTFRLNEVQAQANPIPTQDSAESVFITALEAYEDREFDVAARLFGVVANTYDFHRKTTAALMMRAKSLYHRGDYDLAVRELNSFLSRYPRSRYAIEARNTLALSEQGLDQTANKVDIFRLGVALPLTNEAAGLSQELFNGIRLAVEAYNAGSQRQPDGTLRPMVQMVFQDTHNDAGRARQAIETLATVERVDAIIGPLFSAEAEAAARAAEDRRVVLIAPLATSETVAQGRTYIFQANPTFSLRGRLMARFAVRSLRLSRLALIADGESPEDRLQAANFANEVLRLGAEMRFETYLDDSRDWFRLNETMSRDSIQQAEAVFIPITGNNAPTLIGGALSSMDRIGAGTRVLGTVSWHNLPMSSQASQYNVTYSNDYYVDESAPETQAFISQYRTLARELPTRPAFSGYDVARFLLERVAQQPYDARPLIERIHAAPPFEGLSIRLDFAEGNVNEALYYHRYVDGAVTLMR
ncbi:MAG: ABC transporter substrate-binding protein [Rhodothermales bacterium]|nr:ABC transporter substrate-binding protein [Rhodothermales bacterium]